MTPLVTIGLPFASEDLSVLTLAIQSIYRQTYDAWELIAVADAENLRAIEAIRSIDDQRVRLIADGRSLGLPSRLNQISALAAGDYVARMDADDVMLPERIEKQVQALESRSLDVVGTRAYAIDAQAEVLGRLEEPPLPGDLAGYLRNQAFTHPTVMGRRAWFLDNPYREDLRRAQDKELWLRTAAFSRFEKLDERLLFYRLAGASSLQRYRSTYAYERRIVRLHGPAVAGRRATLVSNAKSLSKELLGGLLMSLGQDDRLLRRKIGIMDAGDLTSASRVLTDIATTAVPTT